MRRAVPSSLPSSAARSPPPLLLYSFSARTAHTTAAALQGTEESIFTDGTRMIERPDGTRLIYDPTGECTTEQMDDDDR